MKFERHKSPKESMRIGKASVILDIDSCYEYSEDGRVGTLPPQIIHNRLRRIESGEISGEHPSEYVFTGNGESNGGDYQEEEWELDQLRGHSVSYNGKFYYIPK